jgi:hypothetical protein
MEGPKSVIMGNKTLFPQTVFKAKLADAVWDGLTVIWVAAARAIVIAYF